jgi:hypothetical protein
MKKIPGFWFYLSWCFLTAFLPHLQAQVPVINSAGNATAQVAVPFAYRITATNNPAS